MIAVDTSVLVDLFRGRSTPAVERLKHFEKDQTPFSIPAICCQELLQGARDKREWNLLMKNLLTQRILHAIEPWHTHVEAARIYFDCRRKGLTVRSAIDCYIAQMVLDRDGVLLHDDEDFETIRKVRSLKTLGR